MGFMITLRTITMNKLTLGVITTALLTTASTTAYAKDNVFIGAQYVYGKYSTVEYYTPRSDEFKRNDSDYSDLSSKFILGKYFNSIGRFYMTLESYSALGINYDYIYSINESFDTFTGLGLTYYRRDRDSTFYNFDGSIDYKKDGTDTIYTIPLRVGGMYNINDHFQAEMAVSYVYIKSNKQPSASYRTEYDNTYGAYIGLNYLF